MIAPKLRSPLAVVCHDAGGCNVILPWLRQALAAGRFELRPVMEGPAARIFAERLPGRMSLTPERALEGAAMLLSGTGWGSDLEHRARRIARERGIFSVALVDHWVNYEQRFVRDGQTVWPDEFWVTDGEALKLAGQAFPGAVLRRFDNLYLQGEVAAIGRVPREGGVLYVLEPMHGDWGRGMPGEFQALEHFMQHRRAAGIPAALPVRLRPHPSDPPGKYDGWIAAQRHAGADVALDRHDSLAAAVSAARWVVGCESYALVVALAAGRQVRTTLPPWGPPCRLPHLGILPIAGREPAGPSTSTSPKAPAASGAVTASTGRAGHEEQATAE